MNRRQKEKERERKRAITVIKGPPQSDSPVYQWFDDYLKDQNDRMEKDRLRKMKHRQAMSDTKKEEHRIQDSERKAKERQSMSHEQKEQYLKKDRERKAKEKETVSQAEKEHNLKKDSVRKAKDRQSMSQAQKEENLKSDRERKAKKKETVSLAQKEHNLKKDSVRKAKDRQSMSQAQKEENLKSDRERKAKKKETVSQAEKEHNLKKDSVRKAKDRQSVSQAEKERNLKKDRERKAKEKETVSQAEKVHNLKKDSVRKAKDRQSVSQAKKKQSLQKDSARKAQKRKSMSKDQKEEDSVRKSKKRRLEFQERQENPDIDLALDLFSKKKEDGPVYICCSCQKLLYRRSVSKFKSENFNETDNSMIDSCTSMKTSFDQCQYVCSTCSRYLRQNTIPPESIGNNLSLEAIPEELKGLSSLEATLISKRVPFMKILGLPRGRQKAIHGCVVNVPINPDETSGILPRLPSSATITVKLKRKLMYRGHVMKQSIRPWKVLCALYHLKHVQDNPHYKDVIINEHWQEISEGENTDLWDHFTNEHTEKTDSTNEHVENQASEPVLNSACENGESDSAVESDDDDSDTVHNKLAGLPYDTCIQPKDLTADTDFLLSIAPGEGKKPLSIHSDKHGEEMSFPQLFPSGRFGFDEVRPKKISLKQYFKNRILNCDNRFSSNIEYLFYAQYRCEAKEVWDCLSIAMRKCKGEVNTNRLTAAEVKNSERLRQLTRNDLSYHFLQKVRGSPAYYNKLLYDLLGMIRQLGPCTWFLTLSAADMKWLDTIRVIGAQQGERFTDEDIQNMTWGQKAFWLRSNPVTAARHFDHRLQMFMDIVVCGQSKPIGEVADFKYRIEFQQRGSPHAHMVIWVKQAPHISEETKELVESFISDFVSCSLPEDDNELLDLVDTVQKHTHSVSCKKSGKLCRFAFPKPPMPKTVVFLPSDTPSAAIQKKYENICSLVHTAVSDKNIDQALELETILADVDVSLQEYMSAVAWLKTKSGQPGILLQRKPYECNINNYNAHLLRSWGANIDIQFVTNVYACVMYVASYMSKPEKTLGDLLKSVSKTCEPQGPKVKMRTVSKKFLCHREVSAQEAVYRLLSMPLSRSSRQVVFVPTNMPDQRTYLLKPLKVIQQMDDDDDDLLVKGMIDKYQARPAALEEVCMAEFFSSYRPCSSKQKEKDDDNDDNEREEVCNTEHEVRNRHLPSTISIPNHGALTCRVTPAIIRTHQFSKQKNEEHFYHSKLMLYLPWRNEELDLKAADGTYKSKYNESLCAIQDNILFYEPNAEEVRQAQDDLQENGPPEDAWALLSAQTEQSRQDERVEGPAPDPDHVNLGQPDMNPQDIGLQRHEYEVNMSQMSNDKWIEMTVSLNAQQRKFHQFIVNWCVEMSMTYRTRQRPKPFHVYLSGGAGVGKSHTVRTIVQTATRLLRVGQSEEDIVVLVTAFTGVAAHNIGGFTLHSVFQLPVFMKKSDDYIPVGSEQLAKMKSKLGNLCLLIIDEISFIGPDILLYIHRRLTDIMTCDEPFGGVSVLAVGDLYQLPPVGQSPVFSVPKSDPLLQLYGSLWTNHFELIELTEIMRQKNEQFALALNRVRTGICTNEDIALFKMREIQKCSPLYPKFALHIFPYNIDVDEHNDRTLQELRSHILTLTSVDTTTDRETQRITNITLKQKDGQLLHKLELAEGARVVLVMNVDVSDGLVNSAMGTITGFHPPIEPDNQDYKPKYILVQFDDETTGKNRRNKYKNLVGNSFSTPVSAESVKVKKGVITACRKQFPLKLAWASTIHKAQGKTLDQLVVCIKGSYRAGQLYTALSRVRTLDGLFILGELTRNSIKIDKNIDQEMCRLKTLRSLSLGQPVALCDSLDIDLRLSVLNVNSLKPHKQCLQKDDTLPLSDICCVTETWLKETDSSEALQLTPNHHLYRRDRPLTGAITAHGGVAVYVCDIFHVLHRYDTDKIFLEYIALLLEHRGSGDRLLVVNVYNSPSTPVRGFLQQLDQLLSFLPVHHVPTILTGDLNIDVLSKSSNLEKLQQVTAYYGFIQYVSKPTHRLGGALDHIYVNRDIFASSRISYSPVHFTDHIGIHLSVHYADVFKPL